MGPHTLYLFNKLFSSFQVAPGRLWFCTFPAWRDLYVLYADCQKTRILLLFSRWVMSDSSVTPWTGAHQAPLSMGLPRQEYWMGGPVPLQEHWTQCPVCMWWPGAPAWPHSAQANYQYFLIKHLIQSFSLRKDKCTHTVKNRIVLESRGTCVYAVVLLLQRAGNDHPSLT